MNARWLRNFLLSLLGALVIALGLSLFTATTATSNFYYSITDLGTLGGRVTDAYGINDAGQVVGYGFTSSGSRAFLWKNGKMKDLGTLGGSSSWAYGINHESQVVGEAEINANTGHVSCGGMARSQISTVCFLPILSGNLSRQMISITRER